MTVFSKPLFLLEEDTDSTLIARLSVSLVYKIAKASREAILRATELLWACMKHWHSVVPRGLLDIFPAFVHRYESKEKLHEHVAYTNFYYQFTDSKKDLVSKKIQHLANVGAFFFKPPVRHKALDLCNDDFFDVASAMLRHIVTADFPVNEILTVAPAKDFAFGSATSQKFFYYEHEPNCYRKD